MTAIGPATQEQPGASRPRLHYLDWLRLLAILGVFLYHASRPFIHQEWLIGDESKSVLLSFIFLVFLGSWGMPLFFLIAGTGSLFALRRRSGRQFLVERAKRLLIPYILGCILLSPVQFYLEWIHKDWYRGSFMAFIPRLWQSLRDETIGPSFFEALGSHLWFLAFLFLFSLIALPLFLWLKTEPGWRFISRLGALGERRGGILLLAIPVVLVRFALQPFFPGYTDWADFLYMLFFFVAGYLLYADERLTLAVRRDGRVALITGLFCTATMLLALVIGGGQEWLDDPGALGFYLAWALAGINGWCWTIAALSFGMRYLDFRNSWLAYGQQAVLPFFVFHQPVIVAIAFFVVGWPVALILKLPVIMLGSFAGTVGFYHLVLRRIGPVRALFSI